MDATARVVEQFRASTSLPGARRGLPSGSTLLLAPAGLVANLRGRVAWVLSQKQLIRDCRLALLPRGDCLGGMPAPRKAVAATGCYRRG